MPLHGEILIRWDARRGWWLDAGFGTPDRLQYWQCYAEAVCAAMAAARRLGSPTILVQHGTGFREAEPPTLLDWPAASTAAQGRVPHSFA